jgi:hypothetical protein
MHQGKMSACRRWLQHVARWPVAAGRSAGWPLAIPTMLEGVPVGPAAKGQQKRTGCEQFLFFNFLL